ncbi:MAG: hypothetical protein AAFN74_00940 [Myxococcota bacterium]
MFTLRFDARVPSLCALLVMTSAACEIDPAEFRFGEQLSDIEFNLFSEDMGVHPNTDVLGDPNNPFVDAIISIDTKFQLLSEAGRPAAFYAWATLLATQPNGENQFYTAQLLETIYDAQLVPEEQLPIVRDMAIRGYQAVLDFFPNDLTFDPTGTVGFRLVTPSFFAIGRLGGMPEGDWIVVSTDDGGREVINGATGVPEDPNAPPEEDEDEEEEDGGQ